MLYPTTSRRPGFTLVELLTVIAIIGILAAVLIPVVGRVRIAGQSSQCASNLRQWGVVLTMFSQDHNNGFPNPWFPAHPDNGTSESLAWKDAVFEGDYVTKEEAYTLLNCPNTEVPAASYSTCYGMNRSLAGWNERYWYVSRMINPTNAIVLGDVGINYSWGDGSGGTALDHPDTAPHPYDTLDFREAGATANLLFADGHVESLSAEEITKQMFEPYEKVND